MAVYSPINKEELSSFLTQYNIGTLQQFKGILEGIENTNYKIKTSQNFFILTIFEKRVNTQDLPFFIDLQNHLAKKEFKCPKPVPNREGQYINTINNKPCVIVSFLDGNKVDHVTINHCKQVGGVLSSLHKLAEDFDGTRANGLHQAQWRNLFQKCKKVPNHQYKEIIQPIEEELDFLDQQWPSDLPKGIIHADVFHDNVFFKNNVFSGLIDFYFSCNDFFAYEIALTINAWCFNNNGQFDFDKFQSLIDGYQIHRVLNGVEKNSMSILLRGATMRILLTRLHDQLYHPEGAFVIPKNPLEYFLILKFHQNNLIFKDN